jgi:quinol-cytochrome oxidoreductase complex cytochrome b subunit
MKPIKFVILAIGILCAIAVFLPFVDAGPVKSSFWELREAKAAPTFIALLGALGMAALAGLGASKGRFSRGMAAGTAALGLIVAVITIVQFEAEMPFGKVAGTGAKILLFGGLGALVASIVGLIKPDRGAA